jgi:hypothetical protein
LTYVLHFYALFEPVSSHPLDLLSVFSSEEVTPQNENILFI